MQHALEALIPTAQCLSSPTSQQRWLKELATMSSSVESLLAVLQQDIGQLSEDAINLLEVCR